MSDNFPDRTGPGPKVGYGQGGSAQQGIEHYKWQSKPIRGGEHHRFPVPWTGGRTRFGTVTDYGKDGVFAKSAHGYARNFSDVGEAKKFVESPHAEEMKTAKKTDEHVGFKKLEGELAHEKGVTDPAGLAAVSGLAKRLDAFEESKHPRAANGQFGSESSSSADTVHSKVGVKNSEQKLAHEAVSTFSPFKEGAPSSAGKRGYERKYTSREKLSSGGTSHQLSVSPDGSWKHREQFTAGIPDKVHGSGETFEGLKNHLQNHFGSGSSGHMSLDPKKLSRADAAVTGLQKRLDAFEESKHPLAANGQFGSGGGGSAAAPSGGGKAGGFVGHGPGVFGGQGGRAGVGTDQTKDYHVVESRRHEKLGNTEAAAAHKKAAHLNGFGYNRMTHNEAKKASDEADRLGSEADKRADEHVGFKKLEGELAHEKGVTNPAGLAAAIGRKKYGSKEMAAKAAAGRKDD